MMMLVNVVMMLTLYCNIDNCYYCLYYSASECIIRGFVRNLNTYWNACEATLDNQMQISLKKSLISSVTRVFTLNGFNGTCLFCY